MTTGEVVYGVIGLVVGFVLGAATLYFTRRSAIAAERSASAAEALVPPSPPPVIWTLTRSRGVLYELRNVGREPATDVTVTLLPAGTEGLLRYPPANTIGAGEAHEIGVLGAGGLKATSAKIECGELPDPSILPL